MVNPHTAKKLTQLGSIEHRVENIFPEKYNNSGYTILTYIGSESCCSNTLTSKASGQFTPKYSDKFKFSGCEFQFLTQNCKNKDIAICKTDSDVPFSFI